MQVDALSNGVRELVISFPTTTRRGSGRRKPTAGTKKLFQFALTTSIFTASTAAPKAECAIKATRYIVMADPKIQASRSIKIARLQFAGNWNPEPGSWRRLAAILHNTENTDLDVQSVKLGEGKLDKSFPIADLTGTFKFTLTDAQRQKSSSTWKTAARLIVDSAGGDAAFAQSAQNELASIFPDSKLDRTTRFR